MGKPLKGARLRARQRERKTAEELQEKQAEDVSFIVDRSGNAKLKNGLIRHQAKKAAADLDKAKVERLIRLHGETKVKEMAEEGRERMEKQKRSRSEVGLRSKQPVYDIWGQEKGSDVKPPKRIPLVAGTAPAPPILLAKTKPHLKKREQQEAQLPALGSREPPTGQSYRPEPVAHAELIQQAATVEINRNKAFQYDKTPLAQGMRPETRALLVGDSSSDESSDEEEIADSTSNNLIANLPKRSFKLTRAERNKKSRQRQQHREMTRKRKAKELTKQLGRIEEFSGVVRKEEKKQQKEKKQPVEALPKKQNPRHVPSLAVALEPSASLRTVKPMGHLVTETTAKNQVTKRRKLSYKGHKNRVGEIRPGFGVLG